MGTARRPPFWPAVAVVAVAGALGAFVMARPDAASAPVAGPDPEVHTVEDRRPTEPPDVLPSFVPQQGQPAIGADGTTTTPATVPTTVPATPPAGGLSCTSYDGWSLTYPSDWYTAEGDMACFLFAPWPIVLVEGTEPDAAISVMTAEAPYEQVIVVATPDDRAVMDVHETTLAGRRALVATTMQVEPGWFDVGTVVHEVYLDDGTRTIIFTTWAADGDLSVYGNVLDALADSYR